MLRELSRMECDMILNRNRVGRIGFRDGASVSIIPISYAYHEGMLYAHTAPGHKLDRIRESPDVAFEVDEIQNITMWRSVLVHGQCEVLTRAADQIQARMLLIRAFQGSQFQATAGHGHRTTLADAFLLRIRVSEVTGRAEHL